MGTPPRDNMAIPDAVKDKVGDMPDVSSLDKDALNALVKQLYDQSCNVFAEKFNMEHEIKKNEVEIHALELEVNDMHGKFTLERDLPKLTAITEEFLEDMDTADTAITLERDLLKLTATTEEFLEDTVMVDTVDTSSENRCNLFLLNFLPDFVQFYDFVI